MLFEPRDVGVRWIAVVSADRADAMRLADATRRLGRLAWFSAAEALLERIRTETTAPLAVVIVLRPPNQDANVALIRRLRARYSAIPLVGRCHLSALAGQMILEAMRAGLNAVAFADYDDLGSVLTSVVDAGRDDCVRVTTRNAFTTLLPPFHLAVLETCVSQARTSLTVSHLATLHGMHRSTLAAVLRNEAHVFPHHFVMWGKLLVAADLLDQGRFSLGRIAADLQLSGTPALSGAFLRYVGRRPTALPAKHALHSACELIAHRLARTSTASK